MKVIFQHLECVNPKNTDLIAVVGRQADGKSVCVKVSNVKPHLCVRNDLVMKPEVFEAELNRKLHEYIVSNQVLKQMSDKEKATVTNVYNRLREDLKYPLVSVFEFQAQDIMNYSESGPISFFKIYVKSKRYLYDVKRILKNQKSRIIVYQTDLKGIQLKNDEKRSFKKKNVQSVVQYKFTGVRNHAFTLYNEQVDFMLQYFIDKNIFSCGWLSAEGTESTGADKLTTCDIEITATDIAQVESQGMAPWRIFSYDIESLPSPHPTREGKYKFPVPEKDPVVTVGGVLQNGNKLEQYVWVLRSFGDPVEKLPAFEEKQDCEYDPSITVVFDFDNEAKLLNHFFDWCVKTDLDLIQGHNCNRFDNSYMLNRYKKLFNRSPVWGRFKSEESSIKETTFNSNQKGSNKQYKLHLPGRVIFDSYDIMKDQHNEGSYKLGDLAQTYLGTDKIPMDYDLIFPKFHSLEGRVDLAVYCVKDAWLVYKLMDKLCKLTVISQMANVTGIGMKDVMNRGQGIRTISLMLRYAKRRKVPLMLPRVERVVKTKKEKQFTKNKSTNEATMKDVEVEITEKFKGAVVVDPDAGFYTDAVSCLDFASLYPSIMVSMNMSYETLVYRAKINQMKWEEEKEVRTIPDYDLKDGKLVTTINPTNPSFVMKEKRLGILPEILWDLWQERKKVKKQMKKEVPHSTMYNVKDGTQLALKVCMNSIYGFTAGYMLPCKEIASSVTKYGRGLILKTKSLIENHPEWGRDGHGCTCVYGDTDSVFVHMKRSLVNGKNNEETVEKAHEMGEIMANYVTKHFIDPVFLEYEKTYLPFLLLKKKRYVGMKNEPGLPRKLHIKGLESVRRDFAPLLVDTQKKVLNAIVKDQDVPKACAIIHDVVKRLKMNQIHIEMLVMSKKLSRPVEDYKAKAPHVELTKRLMKENPEKAPVSGDRVPFVIYSGAGGSSDRACTPGEIASGKFMVDRDYYLEKQLMKPLLRIMERVVSDPQTLFRCRSIFHEGPKKGSIFASWGTEKRQKRKSSAPDTPDVRKKKTKTLSIKSFFVK
jgi:DNA polymerase delta subunit 1